jgi:hypothetical protein
MPLDTRKNGANRRSDDALSRRVERILERYVAANAGGAPLGASYVVIGANATLTAERVLTAGTNITLTDTGTTIEVAASGGGSGLSHPEVMSRLSLGF